MSAREVLLAEARKRMWAAWQDSAEELASQAASTLLGLGMLVPEGGAAELEELRARVAELEAAQAEAVSVSETLYQRLVDEKLAGSALYAALTMPTTPEQRQAALDRFHAVAQKTGQLHAPTVASEMVRADHFSEAARLLEDTGRDDDAVNLLDNVADGIRTHANGEDPCRPCGCPKRFDRHADGCPTRPEPQPGAS